MLLILEPNQKKHESLIPFGKAMKQNSFHALCHQSSNSHVGFAMWLLGCNLTIYKRMETLLRHHETVLLGDQIRVGAHLRKHVCFGVLISDYFFGAFL